MLEQAFEIRSVADQTAVRRKVREGVEAWRDAGVRDLIIVPSSAAGNQMKALEEVFSAFG